jgi:hypothetical protein
LFLGFLPAFYPLSGPGALFWAVLSKPAADGKLQRGNGISLTETAGRNGRLPRIKAGQALA